MDYFEIDNKIYREQDVQKLARDCQVLLDYYERHEGTYHSPYPIIELNEDVKREIFKYLVNPKLINKAYSDLYYDRWCRIPFTKEMVVNYTRKMGVNLDIFKSAKNKFTSYVCKHIDVIQINTLKLTDKKIVVKTKEKSFSDIIDNMSFRNKHYDVRTILNILYYASSEKPQYIENELYRQVLKYKPVIIKNSNDLFHNVKCLIYAIGNDIRIPNLLYNIKNIKLDNHQIVFANLDYFENGQYYKELLMNVDTIIYKYDNQLLLPKYTHPILRRGQ